MGSEKRVGLLYELCALYRKNLIRHRRGEATGFVWRAEARVMRVARSLALAFFISCREYFLISSFFKFITIEFMLLTVKRVDNPLY